MLTIGIARKMLCGYYCRVYTDIEVKWVEFPIRCWDGECLRVVQHEGTVFVYDGLSARPARRADRYLSYEDLAKIGLGFRNKESK